MAEMSFAPTQLRRGKDSKDKNQVLNMFGLSDTLEFLKGCAAPSKSADFISETEPVEFPKMPKKMLAVVLSSYGPPSNLEAVHCNLPQSRGGQLDMYEVLVEIHAASVNPTDCKARKGTLSHICPLKLPAILGIDFSGIRSRSLLAESTFPRDAVHRLAGRVVRAGPKASVSYGDEVFGR